MKQVPINKLRDVIIIELTDNNIIENGSRFYCGCCGEVLGISKKKLKFPFSVKEFSQSLKNKTFDNMPLGLFHKTCGHTMFSFKNGYEFISLKNYNHSIQTLKQQ